MADPNTLPNVQIDYGPPDGRAQHRSATPVYLLMAFIVVFVLLGIHPIDRHDWMLEHSLTALFVVGLIVTCRRFRLSNVSYVFILLFMCLHTLGAHYTYSLVPYDDWSKMLFGKSLNAMLGLERNMFDRLVHFCFGLLLVYPIREIFLRVAHVRGFWGYYLPLDVAMAFSMLYELIEWGAAALFGGDLGQAFLGTQGDQWDAQKDMALATLGALITMIVVACINLKYNKHFGAEFRESFVVKEVSPLGEVRLREMWADPEKKNSP